METQPKTSPATQSRQTKEFIVTISKLLGPNKLELMVDGKVTDTVVVTRSSKLKWEVAEGSGVSEITGIIKKARSEDVFDPAGQPQPDPADPKKKWFGKIKDQDYISEHYSIAYMPDKGGPETYDPIIQVNP